MLLYYRDPVQCTYLDQDVLLAGFEKIRKDIIDYFSTLWSSRKTRHILKKHLTVVVFHVKNSMTFGTLLRPDLLLYLLDTDQDPEYMVKFRHEFGHWIWGAMYGEAPALFNEGLAVGC